MTSRHKSNVDGSSHKKKINNDSSSQLTKLNSQNMTKSQESLRSDDTKVLNKYKTENGKDHIVMEQYKEDDAKHILLEQDSQEQMVKQPLYSEKNIKNNNSKNKNQQYQKQQQSSKGFQSNNNINTKRNLPSSQYRNNTPNTNANPQRMEQIDTEASQKKESIIGWENQEQNNNQFNDVRTFGDTLDQFQLQQKQQKELIKQDQNRNKQQQQQIKKKKTNSLHNQNKLKKKKQDSKQTQKQKIINILKQDQNAQNNANSDKQQYIFQNSHIKQKFNKQNSSSNEDYDQEEDNVEIETAEGDGDREGEGQTTEKRSQTRNKTQKPMNIKKQNEIKVIGNNYKVNKLQKEMKTHECFYNMDLETVSQDFENIKGNINQINQNLEESQNNSELYQFEQVSQSLLAQQSMDSDVQDLVEAIKKQQQNYYLSSDKQNSIKSQKLQDFYKYTKNVDIKQKNLKNPKNIDNDQQIPFPPPIPQTPKNNNNNAVLYLRQTMQNLTEKQKNFYFTNGFKPYQTNALLKFQQFNDVKMVKASYERKARTPSPQKNTELNHQPNHQKQQETNTQNNTIKQPLITSKYFKVQAINLGQKKEYQNKLLYQNYENDQNDIKFRQTVPLNLKKLYKTSENFLQIQKYRSQNSQHNTDRTHYQNSPKNNERVNSPYQSPLKRKLQRNQFHHMHKKQQQKPSESWPIQKMPQYIINKHTLNKQKEQLWQKEQEQIGYLNSVNRQNVKKQQKELQNEPDSMVKREPGVKFQQYQFGLKFTSVNDHQPKALSPGYIKKEYGNPFTFNEPSNENSLSPQQKQLNNQSNVKNNVKIQQILKKNIEKQQLGRLNQQIHYYH